MGYESDAIEIAVTIALIVVWGFWEYREREIRHKKALLDLQNNIELRAGSRANWGKVTTTIVTSLLLLAVAVGGLIFVNEIGLHYAGAVLVGIVELMLVAVLLLLMAARDVRILRKG